MFQTAMAEGGELAGKLELRLKYVCATFELGPILVFIAPPTGGHGMAYLGRDESTAPSYLNYT